MRRYPKVVSAGSFEDLGSGAVTLCPGTQVEMYCSESSNGNAGDMLAVSDAAQ